MAVYVSGGTAFMGGYDYYSSSVSPYEGLIWKCTALGCASEETTGKTWLGVRRMGGSSATNSWAAAYTGVFAAAGGNFSARPNVPIATLEDVTPTSPTDAWAGGTAGTLIHYDGTAWSIVASGTTAPIDRLKSFSASSVLASGTFGVRRFNGTSWSATGQTTAVDGMWPESATEFWVAQAGTALRRSGSTSTNMTPWVTPTGVQIKAVSGSSPTDVWLMGPKLELLVKP